MRVKGIVDLEIAGNNIVKNNTITKLGDMFYKAKSLRWFAATRTIEQGFDFIQSFLISSGGSTMIDLAGVDDNITIYLLNLTQTELDSLTADSQLLPIYKTGTFEIDHSKIVAWASVDRTSNQAKQGTFTKRGANRYLDDLITSLAWEWSGDKVGGTSFNCMSIGVNTVNDGSTRFNGFNIFRGLESNDFIAGETRGSGYMARPNILGITSPTEILLGGSTVDGRARIKLDLVNRVDTELQPGDAAYDFPLVKSDEPQCIIGDKMFYFVVEDLWVYDMNLGTHADTGVNGYNSYVLKTLFTYNGYLYIAGSYYDLYAYDPLTYSRVSSQDLDVRNLPCIPSDIYPEQAYYYKLNYISISNYADNFIIARTNSKDLIDKRAIVVSDLTTASIVKILPCIGSIVAYEINNEMYHFEYYVTDEIFKGLDDNQESSLVDVDGFGQYGVKYCKHVGNLLSFVKYDTLQQIPSDEGARIEYNYKYE